MEYKYEKFVQNYEVRINCSLYVDEQKELYEFDQKLQMVSIKNFKFLPFLYSEIIMKIHTQTFLTKIS